MKIVYICLNIRQNEKLNFTTNFNRYNYVVMQG